MSSIIGQVRSEQEVDHASFMLPDDTAWESTSRASNTIHTRHAQLVWYADGKKPISTQSKDGIHAVVVGYPRWTSSQRRSIADDDPPAQVLLKTYQQCGKNCLKNIKGRYIAIVIDSKKQFVIAAIDRMGIEQLFYAIDTRGRLIFSTDLRSIKEIMTADVAVSNQSIFNYIYFHVIPSPNTIYEGIFKLEPGQYLQAREGDFGTDFYWQPSPPAERTISEDSLCSQLVDTLRIAVNRDDLNSESGGFLSGGLDSSSVCGLAAQARNTPVNAFSIGFDAQGYDEIEYARIASRHFNLNLVEYYVTPDDIADSIDRIVDGFDEPFGNSSAIPTYYCAKLASQTGTNHLLAGDGGDELFGGNERYATQWLFELYNAVPAAVRNNLIEPLLKLAPTWTPTLITKARRYVEQATISLPQRLQTYNFLHMNSPSVVFSSDFLQKISTADPILQMEDWYERTDGEELLDRLLFFDWKLTLADNDLRKVTKMCDLAEVQVSFPMLDDDLVSFSYQIPNTLKLRRGSLRFLYKQAFKNILPPEILNKEKHGFGLPFGVWIESSDRLKSLVNANLSSLAAREIVSPDFIDELRRRHESDHAAFYGNMIWVLVMLEKWLSSNT